MIMLKETELEDLDLLTNNKEKKKNSNSKLLFFLHFLHKKTNNKIYNNQNKKSIVNKHNYKKLKIFILTFGRFCCIISMC